MLFVRLYEITNFQNLLTFTHHFIIINMRLGRVAKRLIERPKTALHPVAFFLQGGIKNVSMLY